MSGSQSRRIDASRAYSDVRKFIENQFRNKSLWRASMVLLPSMAGYLLILMVLLTVPWWLMPPIGLLVGIMGNVLFVIAHDAAHNSLTPIGWLNGLIARICFLPAWHSYTGWIHAHNHVHHGWTNLVTKDYVWAPISKPHYDSLTPLNRWLVRFYRSAFGFAVYYLWEINFKRIFLTQSEVRQPRVRRMWILDNSIMVSALVIQSLLVVQLARTSSDATSWWWLVLNAQVIPTLFTNYLIGFTTYLQHTHPLIPWFDNQDEWTYYIGQVRGTAHTHFPYQIDALFHHVMEHTAHHVDPRIPLYNLQPVQRRIEQAYPGAVVQHRFTWRSFKRTLAICQLYDFQNHCWLDYSGQPTSSRTFNL